MTNEIHMVNGDYLYHKLNDLYYEGLVTRRIEFDRTLFKYQRKVMYEKLWTPELMECRGLVFHNETIDIVTRPVRKLFNYKETAPKSEFSTGIAEFDLDQEVIYAPKHNGFMACKNAEGFYSCTGSMSGKHIGMAIEVLSAVPSAKEGTTDIYEIMHVNDPHIIKRPDDMRSHARKVQTRDNATGQILEVCGSRTAKFREVLEMNILSRDEGYVVYLPDLSKGLKLKSDYYTALKRFARIPHTRIDQLIIQEKASANRFARHIANDPSTRTDLFAITEDKERLNNFLYDMVSDIL